MHLGISWEPAVHLSATGPMRTTSVSVLVCLCVCVSLTLRCGVYSLISQCSLCLCVREFGENLLCYCLQLDQWEPQMCVCVCLRVSVCVWLCVSEGVYIRLQRCWLRVFGEWSGPVRIERPQTAVRERESVCLCSHVDEIKPKLSRLILYWIFLVIITMKLLYSDMKSGRV